MTPLAHAPWIQALGWTLVRFLWQGTVVGAVYAAVRALTRRRLGAHARYAMACAAMGVMAAMPLWTLHEQLGAPLVPALAIWSSDAWRLALPWLVAAWMTGVLVFGWRLVDGWRATRRLRRQGTEPASSEWRHTLETLARRAGVWQPVRLLTSTFLEVPVVIGWWRPVILAPAALVAGLPPAYVEAMLAHELAHIRRLDSLVNLLQSVVEAVLFYHPAVWWVSWEICAERERCCDDEAVRLVGDLRAYAHALAELEARRPVHQQALAANGGSLVDRIRRLLGQAPALDVLPGAGAVLAMSALWLIGVGAAGAHAAPPLLAIHTRPQPAVTTPPTAPSPRPALSSLLFAPIGPRAEAASRAERRQAVATQMPAQSSGQSAGTGAAQGGGRAGTPGAGTGTFVAYGTPAMNLPDGTGAISGEVVDAATHRPIAGAVVTLGLDGAGQATGRPLSQITDEKGRFVFADLPAMDNYWLRASKAGYSWAAYGDLGDGARQHIPIAAGEWFSTAEIALPRLGSISGTVVDERGEPIVGAYVHLLVRLTVAGLPQLASGPVVTTDDRGAYRFAGLTQGNFVVVVPSVQYAVPASTPAYTMAGLTQGGAARNPDALAAANLGFDVDGTRIMIGRFPPSPPSTSGRPQAYPMTFYPGVSDPAAAGTIALGAGEDHPHADVQLRPVATARVSGTVSGPSDALGGLTLRLVLQGAEDLGIGSEAATARVAPDGSFTFLNVPAGSYSLDGGGFFAELSYRTGRSSLTPVTLPHPPGVTMYQASPETIPSAPPATSLNVQTYNAPVPGRGPGVFWARAHVDVGDGDVAGVSIALQRAVTISGRGEWDGDPPPNLSPGLVLLEAVPASGNPSLGFVPGQPGADGPGTFSVSGLLPGGYLLTKLGTAATIESIKWRDEDHTYVPFDASGGHDFTDVVVTLTTKKTTLAGEVPPTLEHPNADAVVIAFPVERAQWSNYGLNPTRIAVSRLTASGTFQVTTLPAGDYFVIAVDPSKSERWQDPAWLEVASSIATRVSLGWGATKTVTLAVAPVK